MPKIRTKQQNAQLWAIAGKLGLTKSDIAEHAFNISGGRTDHTSELDTAECKKLISRLNNLADSKNGVSLRTIQHRRQVPGNIVNIDTQKQAKLLKGLWFE